MSDHIPFDLQVEIIKRLPTKSLLKFRGVSKAWKSLIHSAEFIADYKPQSQHLFIRSGYNLEYVKIIDDDSFPQHKFHLMDPSIGVNFIMLGIIGCSQGLFCLFGYHPANLRNPMYMSLIWNSSIRKSVPIVLPKSLPNSVLGFGVCRNTNDPKIVNIVNKIRTRVERESVLLCPWDVEVYIDGSVCFFASDDGFYTIIAFDLTSEEFNQVYLPDKVAVKTDNISVKYSSMHQLRESIAVVKSKIKAHKQVYKVLLMENGVSKSFTKVFTINLPYASVRTILGFRKNGDHDGYDPVMLVYCEPGSERINRLGISEDHRGTFFVSSYKEYFCMISQICT